MQKKWKNNSFHKKRDRVSRFANQSSTPRKFKLRYTFLDGASCDAEEVFSVCFGEASVASAMFAEVEGWLDAAVENQTARRVVSRK